MVFKVDLNLEPRIAFSYRPFVKWRLHLNGSTYTLLINSILAWSGSSVIWEQGEKRREVNKDSVAFPRLTSLLLHIYLNVFFFRHSFCVAAGSDNE